METWIDMINEQIGSEIWQTELIKVLESMLIVFVCAIPILFCIVWLLTALDYIFTKDRDMPQSFDQHTIREQQHGSSRDGSSQPATRLLHNSNAAA
jgi:hypothetical protein